jgi:chromate transporter
MVPIPKVAVARAPHEKHAKVDDHTGEASGPTAPVVTLREAARTWFRVSLQTFGGPAGQIAVMHRMLVDEKRWIGEKRFLHALNYCMLLPGPEAQQLSIYLGWLLNGTAGGLIAGSLFVLPGFIALMVLSVVYVAFCDTLGMEALFAGIAPAVLAIVVAAVLRVASRALKRRSLLLVAAAAFVALAMFNVPFPLVIIAAGIIGFLGGRFRADVFSPLDAHGADPEDESPPLIPDDVLHGARGSWRRAATIVAIGAVAWGGPLLVFGLLFGGDSVFVESGRFFSGAAVVTFGGAYAVLAYIAQRAVYTYGWLLPGEMVKGLAMAESTPGPLIQVVQFVGFLAAYRNPGALNPWVAGVIAACLVTWVTYVPCFLFIFLGAPHIEALRHNALLGSALTLVTAAVVGVIANLALFFAVHTLFDEVDDGRRLGPLHLDVPVWWSISAVALLTTAVAFWLVFRQKWTALPTLGVCAVVGGALHVLSTWT